MASAAAIVCPHCSAENSSTRDICFKCRESLHVENGEAIPMPSVFDQQMPAPAWATRVWHEVNVPGSVIETDGQTIHEMVVREIGTDSLVFDSDFSYESPAYLRLEFMLEGKPFALDCVVQRTARTLNMEKCYAITVDLGTPGDDFVKTVTEMTPIADNEWWD